MAILYFIDGLVIAAGIAFVVQLQHIAAFVVGLIITALGITLFAYDIVEEIVKRIKTAEPKPGDSD